MPKNDAGGGVDLAGKDPGVTPDGGVLRFGAWTERRPNVVL